MAKERSKKKDLERAKSMGLGIQNTKDDNFRLQEQKYIAASGNKYNVEYHRSYFYLLLLLLLYINNKFIIICPFPSYWAFQPRFSESPTYRPNKNHGPLLGHQRQAQVVDVRGYTVPVRTVPKAKAWQNQVKIRPYPPKKKTFPIMTSTIPQNSNLLSFSCLRISLCGSHQPSLTVAVIVIVIVIVIATSPLLVTPCLNSIPLLVHGILFTVAQSMFFYRHSTNLIYDPPFLKCNLILSRQMGFHVFVCLLHHPMDFYRECRVN